MPRWQRQSIRKMPLEDKTGKGVTISLVMISPVTMTTPPASSILIGFCKVTNEGGGGLDNILIRYQKVTNGSKWGKIFIQSGPYKRKNLSQLSI